MPHIKMDIDIQLYYKFNRMTSPIVHRTNVHFTSDQLCENYIVICSLVQTLQNPLSNYQKYCHGA